MNITAADVKALREKTGAGMMDCKKALVEAQGDFAKAEKLLKELGLLAVKKRSGRATNEGKVFSLVQNGKGVLLELSCETDFVAKNSDFNDLGQKLVEIVIEKNLKEPTDEMQSLVQDAMTRIRENMALRRLKTLHADEADVLVDYLHDGRVGVLVKMTVSDPSLKENAKVKETAADFALHIAAFAPSYLSRDKVDAEYIEEQEGIFRKQADQMDKPDKVKEGIAKGKLNKHLAEICLMDQGYIRDEKTKLGSYH